MNKLLFLALFCLVSASVQDSLNSAKNSIQNTVSKGQSALEKAKNSYTTAKNTVDKAKASVNDINNKFQTAVPQIKQSTSTISSAVKSATPDLSKAKSNISYNFNNAYSNLKTSYNDAVKTVVDNKGILSQNEIANVVNQTVTITASKLTEALKELQNQASTKLEEAHVVLNISIEQEKQILQTGFTLVEAIVDHLNEFTHLNISTEDEAVEINNYVNDQIQQAEDLLKNIRKYITTFITNADEQIRTMTNKTENVLTTVLTSGAEVGKQIDTLTKQITSLKSFDTEPVKLPESLLTVNMTERKIASKVLDTIDTVSKTVTTAAKAANTLTNVANAIGNSLPEGKAKEKIAKITSQINSAVEEYSPKIQNTLSKSKNIAVATDAAAQTVKKAYDAIKNLF